MAHPEAFQDLMREGEVVSQDLENLLTAWGDAGSPGEAPEEVVAAFDRITRNCAACHREFRDVPLSEKGAE